MRLRLLAILALALGAAPSPPLRAEEAPVDFARDVFPILRRSCFECHGAAKQKGELRLDTAAGLKRGGASGAAVEPGKPEASELLRRVTLPAGDADAMPNRGQRLSAAEVAILRRWIEAGAVWPEKVELRPHWAYVPPQSAPPPAVSNPAWLATPVDAFVLARLDREGLRPAPPADKATLLRRVSLDLLGLPPSPEEADAFFADDRPDAYERVVDRLLASPQFGARWARPWLDLARYADSHGFQRDDLREIWAYRDWVIAALSADMPFDQFTLEQLAGDLLPNATELQRVATGFHRCTMTNVEAGSEPEETRVNQVIDRVNTTGAVWLGTTLECAQCHNHKYDPFTQRDYYGLFAFFNNTVLEADRSNPKVPGSIRFLGPNFTLASALPRTSLLDETRDEKGPRDENAAEDERPKGPAAKKPTTLVMQELPEARETRMFVRGDYRSPGEPIAPAAPAALPPLPAGEPNRIALARWLTDRQNPLTARVTVNRWWAELFGRGIVGTVEDFGIQGEPPTHPELLDWLAVELMESGWSMKHVLRAIVLSQTYRQSARVSPELLARDDRNKLLARGPRLRLEAELVRDNALAAAGLLSLKQGGPPIRPFQPDGLWRKVGGEPLKYVVSPGEDRHRRGVYVVWKRGSPYPSFVNFDATARLACTVQRSRSNTPLQALTLLNDPVYVEAAEALADRVLRERPDATLDEQLAHAFRLCVVRPPRSAELAVLRGLYEAQLAAAAAPAAAGDAEAKAEPKAGKKAGRKSAPAKATAPAPAAAERGAWQAVAATLLNLDETITKP